MSGRTRRAPSRPAPGRPPLRQIARLNDRLLPFTDDILIVLYDFETLLYIPTDVERKRRKYTAFTGASTDRYLVRYRSPPAGAGHTVRECRRHHPHPIHPIQSSSASSSPSSSSGIVAHRLQRASASRYIACQSL